ncbi:MAG: hypothetical protein ACFFA0_10010 [Promethearchaeota archaeon]
MVKPKFVTRVIIKSKCIEYIRYKGCDTIEYLIDGKATNELIVDIDDQTLNDAFLKILDKAIKKVKEENRTIVEEKDIKTFMENKELKLVKQGTIVENLFLKSKVRDYIKSKECIVTQELLDSWALNDAIFEILDKAIAQAKLVYEIMEEKSIQFDY